jgi:hypothetical protein
MPVQVANPFGAFLEGRQARQDEQYGERRNALAQMELEQAPRDIANRNALAARQQEQYSQEQIARSLEQTAAAAMRIAQSSNPRAELQANREFAANLMKQHPELTQMGDDDLKQYMGWIAGEAQSKLGIAPAQPKTPESFTLGAGQTRYGPDGKQIASAPVSNAMTPYQTERLKIEREKLGRPGKQQNSFRTLTPAEVEAAGLPAGTSAQVDQSGKIDVLSKKDTTAALSQKDATVAKIKLNQLKVAKQQLQNVRNKFAKIKGTLQAGKGQGWIPLEAGEAFDKAVDSMKGSLTAITRVPGVGSMSDYESRIDQSKFPKRGDYESVTDDQIVAIEELLTTIESGYTDLLGGGSQQPTQSSPPKQQSGEPVRVTSPQEAMALPPGTVFITPDGRRKVR